MKNLLITLQALQEAREELAHYEQHGKCEPVVTLDRLLRILHNDEVGDALDVLS